MFAKQIAVVLFVVMSVFSFANADSRPTYTMRNMSTSLSDYDVDYFSRPLVLVRTSATSKIHWVEFNVAYYEPFCVYWDNQCVQYDNQGRCMRWERVCRQWDYRAMPSGKRIQLNFRNAPVLAAGEEETYELWITRQKPFGQGEDRVSTNMRSEKTVKPVVVRKMNEFDYDIVLKQP